MKKQCKVKSGTSGNLLSAWWVKDSSIRKFFGMRHIRLGVLVTGFSDEWLSLGWYRPNEIEGYNE